MSEFDRRTGVKHLRVRGMKAVRFAAFMKAIGLNILRASRHWGEKTSPMTSFYSLFFFFLAFPNIFQELFREDFSTRTHEGHKLSTSRFFSSGLGGLTFYEVIIS